MAGSEPAADCILVCRRSGVLCCRVLLVAIQGAHSFEPGVASHWRRDLDPAPRTTGTGDDYRTYGVALGCIHARAVVAKPAAHQTAAGAADILRSDSRNHGRHSRDRLDSAHG